MRMCPCSRLPKLSYQRPSPPSVSYQSFPNLNWHELNDGAPPKLSSKPVDLLQSQGRGVSLPPSFPISKSWVKQSSAVIAYIRSKSPFVAVTRSCLCDSDASNATKRIILLAIASYLVQHIINLNLVPSSFPSSLTSRHIHNTPAILPLHAPVVTPFLHLINTNSRSDRAVDTFPSYSYLNILP